MLRRMIALALILASLGVQAAAAEAPPEVSAWIRAFFSAYSARDTDALRALFTPEATVSRMTVDEFLDDVRRGTERFSTFSAAPRGNPQVTQVPGGYAVRQPAVRTFVLRENGLEYRHLVIYDWTLSTTRGSVLAIRMYETNEPEPNLPVGRVRIAAVPDVNGKPGETPQEVFHPQDTVCLVITSSEVQGGHFFAVQLTDPDGYDHLLPSLFALGPAERPGPLERPVGGCLRTPKDGWKQGAWKAEVFVEGYVRGRTEWQVKP